MEVRGRSESRWRSDADQIVNVGQGADTGQRAQGLLPSASICVPYKDPKLKFS